MFSMKEPKEEPLDDFPLEPPVNEISNQPANIMKEPKEEPLDLFLPYSIENEPIDREFKEEEMDEEDETPSQFDVNAFGDRSQNGHFSPSHSQDETESLCGEEIVMQKKAEKEEKLRKKAMQHEQVPFEEVEVQRTRSRIISKPVKYGDFLMDTGTSVEKSTSKVEKSGRTKKTGKDDQPFQTATETPKGRCMRNSSKTIEVENRRKSTRTVAKPTKYADYIDYSVIPLMEEKDMSDKTVTTTDPIETTKKADEVNIQDGNEVAQSENFEHGDVSSIVDDLIDEKEKEEGIDHSDTPKGSSLTIQAQKEKRPLRKVSKTVKGDESSEYSEEEDEPSVKKSKSESVKKNAKCDGRHLTLQKIDEKENPNTPKCILCEKFPSTVAGYAQHLKIHKSTLKENGIYLKCACTFEYTCYNSLYYHDKKCDGRQFTLQKLSEKEHPNTPKCILCEKFPSTAVGYSAHVSHYHKSTLRALGFYIICACSSEVTTHHYPPDHPMKCDGRQFAIHELNEKCILCEKFPSTAFGYTQHLLSHHKTTLKANGFYLKCSCSFEVLSHESHANHNKKCDGRSFALLRLEEKENPYAPKCILCEKYPSSVFSYTLHLNAHHKSTLKENGIYLKCACSFEVLSHESHANHNKKCDGRRFTLHKISEK